MTFNCSKTKIDLLLHLFHSIHIVCNKVCWNSIIYPKHDKCGWWLEIRTERNE